MLTLWENLLTGHSLLYARIRMREEPETKPNPRTERHYQNKQKINKRNEDECAELSDREEKLIQNECAHWLKITFAELATDQNIGIKSTINDKKQRVANGRQAELFLLVVSRHHE